MPVDTFATHYLIALRPQEPPRACPRRLRHRRSHRAAPSRRFVPARSHGRCGNQDAGEWEPADTIPGWHAETGMRLRAPGAQTSGDRLWRRVPYRKTPGPLRSPRSHARCPTPAATRAGGAESHGVPGVMSDASPDFLLYPSIDVFAGVAGNAINRTCHSRLLYGHAMASGHRRFRSGWVDHCSNWLATSVGRKSSRGIPMDRWSSGARPTAEAGVTRPAGGDAAVHRSACGFYRRRQLQPGRD